MSLCARHRDELTVAASELRERGAVVATAVCDVRDDASVATAFANLEGELGAVDVLVNVAGIIGVGPIEALTIDDFREALETNLLGAIRAVYAVLPQMRARRTGRIVNITSLGGEIAIPHMLPYCASKFGFVGFSDGLHAEVARDGIVVTTVVPGLMRTGSPPQATFAGQPSKEYTTFALSDATPLTSIAVDRAAREMLDACERGDGRLVVSWQAKAALVACGFAPRLVRAAMTAAGCVLPSGGPNPERRYGIDSESPATRSPIMAWLRRATASQNESVHPRA